MAVSASRLPPLRPFGPRPALGPDGGRGGSRDAVGDTTLSLSPRLSLAESVGPQRSAARNHKGRDLTGELICLVAQASLRSNV